MELHMYEPFLQGERRRRASLWPTAQAVGHGVGSERAPEGRQKSGITVCGSSVAPAGAEPPMPARPRLAPWATFFRPYGAAVPLNLMNKNRALTVALVA